MRTAAHATPTRPTARRSGDGCGASEIAAARVACGMIGTIFVDVDVGCEAEGTTEGNRGGSLPIVCIAAEVKVIIVVPILCDRVGRRVESGRNDQHWVLVDVES